MQNPNEYDEDAMGGISKLEMLKQNLMGEDCKRLPQILQPPWEA